MEDKVKQKKRLKKPQKRNSPKIQTIVSSPIPSTPIEDIRKPSKSVHRYQTPATKEVNFIPKSCNRPMSARAVTPIATGGDIDTSSINNRIWGQPNPKESVRKRTTKEVTLIPKTSNRPMSARAVTPIATRGDTDTSSIDSRIWGQQNPKESVRKRSSKKPTFLKNASKARLPTQPKKFLEIQRTHSLSPKKLTSKDSITANIKKPRIKPNKRLRNLLRDNSCKDIKSMRQDCHRIEIVFENRRKTDKTTRLDNLNALGKLYLLVTFGGLDEFKPRESVVGYVTNYLCTNSYLLFQLVYIMADAEDLRTCLYTIKLLYQLVIKSYKNEGEKTAVKKALSSSSILGTLIESMYSIHIRFLGNTEYKEGLQKVHSHILQIIVSVCKTKSARKLFRRASEGTVKLIGRLTCSCQVNKDLANCLLEAVKIICIKKNNSTILASKKFFDGVCACYYLTHKLYTVPMILKVMSRVKPVRNCMSENVKIVNLILEMICYSGKKSLNKRALLTTLYRIAMENSGLKILAKNEMFYKLFHYFRKNDCKQLQQRLVTIKMYSILNRAVNQIILPSVQLNMDLCLPECVKKCLEEEDVSEESEPENDESEDDSEDDDDSDDTEVSAIDINSLKKTTTDPTKHKELTVEDLLTAMSPFYVEVLLNVDETDYSSIFKFDIYEGIVSLTNRKVIENRVHRGLNNDRHAYPDAVMLEPEYDEHVLNASINNFSKDNLSDKLKCARGVSHNPYIPRVVYDLDELHGNRKQPLTVPHPTTFIPNVRDRNQPSILSALKFESRFECGNLRKVIQIERYEYELLLTPDTRTTKGLQWFYFQVSNMVPGIAYTFNIANFLKFNSQHNHGMQPLMFSVMDYALYKRGWQRVGEEIIYYGNNYTDETGDKQYRTLLFSVSFRHANDYVYFAYHYPYTYTRLMIKLFPLVNYKMREIYVRIDKLCNTVKTRNEMALLTITGAWNRAHSLGIPLRRRPIIFITARVHPGETNASWIMEGIINFLLDETDPDAVIAREHFIFKIIPMLNPEGVIHGNTRTGLTGSDLNRCWANPNKITCPEIYYAKRLIACAKKHLKLPVAAYIDIHGHSRKKYFFFYGCNPKMSWNKKDKASGNLLETLKILPDIVHDMNPNIRLSQCKYTITKNRESTGRVVMWREFDIKHSYTLECSYSFASDKQCVNTRILSDIGSSVIASLGKIADIAYNSRKAVPSLALDYTYVNNPSNKPTTEQHSVESRLKEGADKASMYPLIVSSRVLDF